MNQNVGAIEYDARIKTSNLKSDAREAEGIVKRSADNMASSTEKSSGRASAAYAKIGTVVKASGIALVAAGTAAAVFGVKSAASFQQTRIGLENMLGSADKARKMLSDISKFAAETPFEFPELAGAAKQLVAFGFSAESAFETMKQLGDVSAAVGAPIGDLSYLMGTLKTQGRAMLIDIRQFAQRGIPIYEYLAKTMGVTEAEVSKLISAGKVGFPEVQKAFAAMTAEGGKFHNTMEAQSKSLSGRLSTLKDVLGQTLRNLVGLSDTGDVIAGGLFDRLTIGIAAVTNGLANNSGKIKEFFTLTINAIIGFGTKAVEVGKQVSEYLLPKLRELWTSLSANVIPALKDLWHNVIEPLLPVLGTILVAAIGFVVTALKVMSDGIGFVHRAIKDANPVVWALIGFLGALKAAMMLQAGFAAITAGLTLLRTVTIPAAMLKITALRLLIAAPMALGAIAIAAAIAALVAVAIQAKKTWDAVQGAKNAAEGLRVSNNAVLGRLQAGTMSNDPAVRARSWAAINAGVGRNASGTDNWRGGATWVGERGPEIVNLPRGSQVIPNHRVNDATNKGNGSTTTIGNVNISNELDGRYWLRRLTNTQDAAFSNLTPQGMSL